MKLQQGFSVLERSAKGAGMREEGKIGLEVVWDDEGGEKKLQQGFSVLERSAKGAGMREEGKTGLEVIWDDLNYCNFFGTRQQTVTLFTRKYSSTHSIEASV